MEVIKEGTSTDGKKYRIYRWSACNTDFYEIEYLKPYHHVGGTPCNVWCPVFEPQKIFTNKESVLKEWSYLLIPF